MKIGLAANLVDYPHSSISRNPNLDPDPNSKLGNPALGRLFVKSTQH